MIKCILKNEGIEFSYSGNSIEPFMIPLNEQLSPTFAMNFVNWIVKCVTIYLSWENSEERMGR